MVTDISDTEMFEKFHGRQAGVGVEMTRQAARYHIDERSHIGKFTRRMPGFKQSVDQLAQSPLRRKLAF